MLTTFILWNKVKTLRTYTSFLLSMLIMGVSFHSGFVQLSYNLNKGYIASELCVNQDKPQLNCEGKCYLNKQLNKAQDKPVPQEAAISNIPTISWTAPKTASWLPAASKQPQIISFIYSNEPKEGYLRGIYHPPTLT